MTKHLSFLVSFDTENKLNLQSGTCRTFSTHLFSRTIVLPACFIYALILVGSCTPLCSCPLMLLTLLKTFLLWVIWFVAPESTIHSSTDALHNRSYTCHVWWAMSYWMACSRDLLVVCIALLLAHDFGEDFRSLQLLQYLQHSHKV